MLQTLNVLVDNPHPRFRGLCCSKKISTAYTPVFTVSILRITGKKIKKGYSLLEPYCLHRMHGLVYIEETKKLIVLKRTKESGVVRVRKTMVYRVNQAKTMALNMPT